MKLLNNILLCIKTLSTINVLRYLAFHDCPKYKQGLSFIIRKFSRKINTIRGHMCSCKNSHAPERKFYSCVAESMIDLFNTDKDAGNRDNTRTLPAWPSQTLTGLPVLFPLDQCQWLIALTSSPRTHMLLECDRNKHKLQRKPEISYCSK